MTLDTCFRAVANCVPTCVLLLVPRPAMLNGQSATRVAAFHLEGLATAVGLLRDAVHHRRAQLLRAQEGQRGTGGGRGGEERVRNEQPNQSATPASTICTRTPAACCCHGYAQRHNSVNATKIHRRCVVQHRSALKVTAVPKRPQNGRLINAVVQRHQSRSEIHEPEKKKRGKKVNKPSALFRSPLLPLLTGAS